jgi:uncharacterized protein (DUF2384 family)
MPDVGGPANLASYREQRSDRATSPAASGHSSGNFAARPRSGIDQRWPEVIQVPGRAQQNLLRNHHGGDTVISMPVATARKVEALRTDFRSAARLADMLGVSRSQVTRWLRGAGIDPLNAEKVDVLELVWSNLLRLYDKEAALAWLFGLNPALGDRRPIDLIRAGRAEELMRAIRAERSDSFA